MHCTGLSASAELLVKLKEGKKNQRSGNCWDWNWSVSFSRKVVVLDLLNVSVMDGA